MTTPIAEQLREMGKAIDDRDYMAQTEADKLDKIIQQVEALEAENSILKYANSLQSVMINNLEKRLGSLRQQREDTIARLEKSIQKHYVSKECNLAYERATNREVDGFNKGLLKAISIIREERK